MHKTGKGDSYPQQPTNFFKKLISNITPDPKHPTVAFYRGAYIAYNKYSIMLGSEGKQGSAITAGFTWGFTKPLYSFRNGNTIDFEAGISAGFAYADMKKYVLERESNCYRITETKPMAFQPIPVISDLRLGFIYRIGDYPSTKKYRWRYDCDLAYQQKMDDWMTAEKNRLDSIANARKDHGSIYEEFMEIYNAELKRFAEEETKTTADNAIKEKAAKAAATAKAADLKASKKQKKDEAKEAAKEDKKKKADKKKGQKENIKEEEKPAEQSEAAPAENAESKEAPAESNASEDNHENENNNQN